MKKIKKIQEYDVIEGEESLICEENYNENGNMTSKIFYNGEIYIYQGFYCFI